MDKSKQASSVYDKIAKPYAEEFSKPSEYIKEFLSKCGNELVENNDNEWIANILYTYLNKKTCEVQKFGGKLMQLSGIFLNSDLEDIGEEGGEDE